MPKSRPHDPATPPRAYSTVAIDYTEIVDAALTIIDDYGVDRLFMRALARVIGRDPMTVYRFVPNKSALLDAVAERVLTTLAAVDSTDPDWHRQLRMHARRYRALTLAHPNTVVLIVSRPLAGPLGLRSPLILAPVEAILALLVGAGFTAEAALAIYRALTAFLHGHALQELQEHAETSGDTVDLTNLHLRHLIPGSFPIVQSLASPLGTYDGSRELERGLELLLTGIDTDDHTPTDT